MKTETLREVGAGSDSYVSTWDFYDGLGRHVQSHVRHWNPSYNGFNLRSATRYDSVGRIAATVDPKYRNGTAGTYSGVNWSNVGASHQIITYPADITGVDGKVTTGCTTGSNTRVAFMPSTTGSAWASTVTTQCGLNHRSWDRGGHLTTTTTDAFGNTTRLINPAGDQTNYTYNLRHQLESVVDPVGNTTTYTYQRWNNQPTGLNDPDLGAIGYTYDLHGRLETQTDARGVTLDVGWDNANRPLNVKHVTGSTWTFASRWTYDPAGHAGQLATTEHWNRRSDTTQAGYVKQTHSYNNRHQVVSTTWQIPGLTDTIYYTYRDSGQPDTITYPNGVTVDYGYNRLEQPDSVTSSAGTLSPWINYDAARRPVTTRRGSAGPTWSETTRTYDPNTQRMTNLVTINDSGTKVQDYTYTYDPHGLIAKIKDISTVGGQSVNQTSCFVYDLMHQLKRAYTRTDHTCGATGTTDNQGPDPYQVIYTHNKTGAITSATGTGTVAGNYTYPAAGQPRPHAPTTAGSHTYTYDAAGNRASHTTGGQTETYSYDVQNRLLAIGGAGPGAGSSFLYDAAGTRVRRTVPGQPTVHYLDGGRYEEDSTGSTTIHVTIAGQTVGAIVDGVIWTTATDHLGSASYSTDPTGTTQLQRYLPFGGIRGGGAHTQPTDRGYTGQLNDHTGLYHYNARYYDPTLHQFTQPDTVVPNASLSTDWNRYTYARNNPLTYTDPDGHAPCSGSAAVLNGCPTSSAKGSTGSGRDLYPEGSTSSSASLPTRTSTPTIRVNLFIPDDYICSMGPFCVKGDGRGFSSSASLEENRAIVILDFSKGNAMALVNQSCRGGVLGYGDGKCAPARATEIRVVSSRTKVYGQTCVQHGGCYLDLKWKDPDLDFADNAFVVIDNGVSDSVEIHMTAKLSVGPGQAPGIDSVVTISGLTTGELSASKTGDGFPAYEILVESPDGYDSIERFDAGWPHQLAWP